MEEDPTKKEEERLMRSMNKAGGRKTGLPVGSNARPVSWNVHLSGRSVGGNTVTRKAEQDEAIKILHDQIKQDGVFKLAASNESTAEQPYKQPQRAPTSPKADIASPPLSLEDEAELNAFNAFNEQRELERINKWTRGTGGKPDPNAPKKAEPTFERPVPAVLLRQFDGEAHPHPHPHEKPLLSPTNGVAPAAPVFPPHHQHEQVHPDFPVGVVHITNNVTVAAKALRQRNSEALVKASISVVVSAKTLAALVGEDPDVTSWAKILEAATSQLRARIDSGGDGHEFYNQISDALAHLYLSVVALS